MTASSVVAEAAEILAAHAEELRVCSTFEGSWGEEHEARAEYQRIGRVVAKLRWLEVSLDACLVHCIAVPIAFLVGYGVAKWLG